MYFSQNAIILVMLMFVISAVFYSTIEYKTKAVEDEITIKKVSLYEKNIINSIERNIDKIVEDAFVNASYKIMKERKFFATSNEAVAYITTYIKNEINTSLKCLKDNNYSNISYDISSVEISPTDNPLIIHLYCEIDIKYKKKLNNGEIIALKPLIIDKDVKLSRIPDPYVYLNKFYYNWTYYKIIYVNNFPDDSNNHTFCIILNSTNFNYNHMHNPNSPTELRVIGWNSSASQWNIVLPYWVQTWRKGNNEVSIIWVRCNKNQLGNYNPNNNRGYIKLLYNSTTPVDRQNPEGTFIFFDDFDYYNPNKWDSIGYFIINNSNITVIAGVGSSVYTKQNYSSQIHEPGYELMFRANFTPLHAQGVGFFNHLDIDSGIGWDCYEWNPNWLCMRVGDNWGYVPNGYKYLNSFYIYDIKWYSNGNVTFTIYNNTLTKEYSNDTFTNGFGVFPISINAVPPEGETSNANVTVDWIFLKDINGITTTVSNEEYTNPSYIEEKPKTFTGTIYYGEPGKYVLVYNGSYSIIGLFTNKTDYWLYPNTPGYKPLIEED